MARPVLVVLPAIIALALAVIGPLLAPRPSRESGRIPFAAPDSAAWLGTDHLGRDVLSAVLAGGQALVVVAAAIAAAVTACAAVLGAVAALRPRLGVVVQRVTDMLILVPPVLAILLVTLSWPGAGTFGLIAVATIIGTPYAARVFTAAAGRVAASGYVEVAIGSGESLTHLVTRELLPNLRPTIRTQLGLRFVEAIYLVGTAAFLQLPGGLGEANWAIMVRENSSGILLNPWAVVAPALAIGVVAVSVAFVIGALGRRENNR
ncbi:ABC transporter permease [Nocardia sp. NPDC101769]|uniref:ABC transporter permease n=1 Tax=Nocardia sp. NPDC101769 TaxID=3364333 RepID=UPI003818E307